MKASYDLREKKIFVSKTAYASLKELEEKGWKSFYSDSRYIKNIGEFKIILHVDGTQAFYEAYLNNNIIYKSSDMPLEDVLNMQDDDIVSFNKSFHDTKLMLEQKGFLYKSNNFEKRDSAAGHAIVYTFNPWDNTFKAEFMNKVYDLSDVFNFDFDAFKKVLEKRYISELGASFKRLGSALRVFMK